MLFGLRLFRRSPKPAARSAPRQLPAGFKAMPLVRSYATTDAGGNILHTQVRRDPATGILVQTTSRVS